MPDEWKIYVGWLLFVALVLFVVAVEAFRRLRRRRRWDVMRRIIKDIPPLRWVDVEEFKMKRPAKTAARLRLEEDHRRFGRG